MYKILVLGRLKLHVLHLYVLMLKIYTSIKSDFKQGLIKHKLHEMRTSFLVGYWFPN